MSPEQQDRERDAKWSCKNVRRSLRQDCKAEHRTEPGRSIELPCRVRLAEQSIGEANKEKRDNVIVLCARRLKDPHGDACCDQGRKNLLSRRSAEPARDRRDAKQAAHHGKPLGQIRESIAPGKQAELENDHLGEGRAVELSFDCGRIMSKALLACPMLDTAKMVGHRVPGVRRGADRHQKSHRKNECDQERDPARPRIGAYPKGVQSTPAKGQQAAHQ